LAIDPIDGTYDYINDLDEFTINAGLIIEKNQLQVYLCTCKKRMFYSYGSVMHYELIDGKPKLN
jgi:3'(2'), 5'-bisphosphate nucleotidase